MNLTLEEMERAMVAAGVDPFKAKIEAVNQFKHQERRTFELGPQSPLLPDHSAPAPGVRRPKSSKGRHLKSPTESQEQRALFKWIDGEKNHTQSGYAYTRPEFYRIFHVPNGGYRSLATAVAMKAEGVRHGYADIAWDLPRGGFAGFRGELKRRGDNKISPAQIEWAEWYERCNLYTCAVEGWEAMRDELLRYYASPIPKSRR